MGAASRFALLIRSLFWTVAIPGMVAGYIPWAVFGFNQVSFPAGEPLSVLGFVCIAAGSALLAWCIWDFAASGKGTLSPLDPPTHLVVRGLYRYVRNPMYVAVSTIVLGEAAAARSLALVWYWAFFFLAVNMFVIGYEEPYLRSQFGASYDEYTRAVGRWIPWPPRDDERARFETAIADLKAGSFSKLDPLFDETRGPGAGRSWIVAWCTEGKFDGRPDQLAEALTCAAFNGRTAALSYLLSRGVSPAGGSATGLDALHWAVNRGQLDAVRMLLEHHAPLETVNMHGATPLGTARWSAVNEPRPQHQAIVEALLAAGANPVHNS